jgi:hypothetical protein
MSVRAAGDHARQTTRHQQRLALLGLGALVVVGAAAAFSFDLEPVPVLAGEALVILGALLIERFAVPVIECWAGGAAAEEQVGRLLEAVEAKGWLAIHDVDASRGNIDSVVLGPGGLFAIEVKSHRGGLDPDRLDPAMLPQAYAQRKWLETATAPPRNGAVGVLTRLSDRQAH